MFIPDVHGSAPGRLERLLTVVTREGSTFAVLLHRLSCVHAIHMGAHLFLILEFLPTICTHVHPRYLPVLVTVPHVPLQAGVQMIRDATRWTGEGRLCRVGDDDSPSSC